MEAMSTPTDSMTREDIEKKVFWWQDDGPRTQHRILTQIMVFADYPTANRALQLWPQEAFVETLANPPPGIFDPRSWHYWHVFFGIRPVPPLPQRSFPP
jgi:hypothetical protein